jgi:hypothetical protein
MSYEIKCGNCGKHLLTYESYEKKYKSPLNVCKKCGCEYIDPRCQELAVTGMPEKEFKLSTTFIMLIIGILIVWRGIYLFGMRMLNMPDYAQWVLPTVILLLGLVFIVGAIVEFILIVSGSKRKKYERLMEESQTRMLDEEYVEKLKKYGYLK